MVKIKGFIAKSKGKEMGGKAQIVSPVESLGWNLKA